MLKSSQATEALPKQPVLPVPRPKLPMQKMTWCLCCCQSCQYIPKCDIFSYIYSGFILACLLEDVIHLDYFVYHQDLHIRCTPNILYRKLETRVSLFFFTTLIRIREHVHKRRAEEKSSPPMRYEPIFKCFSTHSATQSSFS